MHRIAYRISSYSVTHGWINADDQAICCYAFERRLLSALFLLTQFIIYAPLGKLFEAFIFITVVLTFRRRVGGIHASSEWLCQIISTASVLVSVLILGPAAENLPPIAICIGNATLILCLFLIKPLYPPQVHFSQHEIDGNIHRKNVLLVLLVLAQVLSVIWLNMLFIIYSSIGLLLVIFTIIIGRNNIGKDMESHDISEKNIG